MIYIDLYNFPPTKRWLDKAKALTQELESAQTPAERTKIIDDNQRIWKAIKKHLHALSFGKCWYSEARDIYSHYHVDHFRPKKSALDEDSNDQGGYWWLTFDWKNYRLCGSVGNSKKSDNFCVKRYKANRSSDPIEDEIFYFLDPTNKDDVKSINFNENGEVIPANSDPTTWEYIRAKYSIKWYDLNYDDLKEERRRLWKKTVLEIDHTKDLIAAYNQDPSATNKELVRAKFDYFRHAIAPCAELSATVQCCLRSTGLDWAVKLAGENLSGNDIKKYCAEYLDR